MEEGDERSLSFTFLRVGPGTVEVRVVDVEGRPVAVLRGMAGPLDPVPPPLPGSGAGWTRQEAA